MRTLTLGVVAAAVMWGASGSLPAPERSYNILMLLPVASYSHMNMFMPLAEALADRGHKIVMLTNLPRMSNNPNIREIVHGLPFVKINKTVFDIGQDGVGGFTTSKIKLPPLAKELYNVPAVKKLYEKRKDFDLIVIDHLSNEISTQFPDLPPLLEIEKNQSLSLLNTHFSISTTVPLLPSQVEVGAMHCRPAKPLPEDLESWITDAGVVGVIYFSLGSVVQAKTMPQEYLQAFLEAFRRLPQRVLWKYKGEMEGVSGNIRVSSWFPQQDILAHDNVKVFISHGGLNSVQESIFHATPLLVLPVFGDQPTQAVFVESSGLGHMLEWEELTADIIVNALTDIINEPKYKEAVSVMSASLRDQLTTPQERAVFWTEYVIRHRGAPQLRCPATQLSWVEFLLLDVVGLLLMALLLLLLLLRRFSWAVFALVFTDRVKKKME